MTSIFNAEVEWFENQGYTRLLAIKKATRYYRKHTAREVIVDFHDGNLLFEDESRDATVDDTIDLERTVRYVLSRQGNDRNRKTGDLLCLLLRLHNIDHCLSDDTWAIIQDRIGDIYPESMCDVAESLGFQVDYRGTSSSLVAYRRSLGSMLAESGYCAA